jgi:hypothetical protein
MFEKTTKKGTIEIRGTKFQYEIYYSPIQHSNSTKEAIINKYGTRLHNGQLCLGITKDIVRDTLSNNDYNVIGFVKNASQEDEASGALQYWDWCNAGEKQLWIGDLCRETTLIPKPDVSPVEALLELFGKIAKSKQLRKIHLMVHDDKGPNMDVLPKIYKKYGFNESNACTIDGFMVMYKDLVKVGGTRNKRRKHKRNTRRA